jgi:error-prone DNA polymerase
MSDYVELRCASAFSFLEAASDPEDLVDRAAELGHRALALADRAGLYGIPRFHRAAKAAGIEAIIGARVLVRAPPPPGQDERLKYPPQAAKGGAQRGEAERSSSGRAAAQQSELLLLVESRRGYRNLSRLLTRAHEKGAKGEAWASWDEVEEHAAGLCCLLRGDASLEPAPLDRALGVFRHGHAYVDVARHLDRAREAGARLAAAMAEARGVPIVASNDVRHARAADRPLYDVLSCLREKTTLDAAGRRLAPNAERHLVAPAAMAERFADRPAWLAATRAVAERCAFRLGDLGYRFPTFPVPEGETQASWLRRLAFAGARQRYGSPLPTRARRQLERELAVIGKLDLAGYFLIVWDVARFAREHGMLAQGRGSAANSAVCYALGITAVDPVGMELLFERFLSEERGEWPDIDIDLPSGEKREEAIQYVFGRYGQRQPAGNVGTGAAMTANVITWRTRLAVREVGKVLGLEPDAIDRLAKLLSTLALREDLDETRALLRQGGVDPAAPRIRALLGLVERLHGLPRHLGQHSGGIVIAAGHLDEVVPIEPAAMPGRRVIQWDKDDCADLGIIKIDLLGLGMLNALEHTLRLAREHEGIAIDLAKLPPDDPATYAMIQRADTMGTFQIESRAQMATLPRMKPERFYDLVVEVAIIRPGPIVGKMVHPYLNRRAGREPVSYPHPSLEPILRRTLGVPLFQEQLLRIAMTAAGFSGGEAEELRRAMGFKRSRERMERLELRLRRGMDERGIRGEAQDAIVRGISSFALYGFPESHAASFALIAYASAYLKCHHPAAFLAGLLDAWPMGFYSPASLVKDAQRHGVEVRPIDVSHSSWLCTLEAGALSSPQPHRAEGPAVRLGLRFVRGLREASGRSIETACAERRFAHAADLAQRAGLSRAELFALAELGALGSIDGSLATRREALWQVAGLEPDSLSLLAGAPSPETPSPLPAMTPLEETLADYRASGLSTGPHVMAHLRPSLRARGLLAAVELRALPNGRWVRTAGHVIVRQRPGSANGMCFLTLEDETGTSNAVLTPPLFRRFRIPLHTAALVSIAGPLQNVDGVVHVRVKKLEPLVPAGRSSGMPDSHDYR